MVELPWSTLAFIAINFTIGSLTGALIYALIAATTHKRTPVGCRVDVLPPFEDPLRATLSRSEMRITDGQKDWKYEDLQIVQIQVSNRGQEDLDELRFGLSWAPGHTAVFVEVRRPDRYHQIEQLTPLKFSDPKPQLDFVLRPLNRQDSYSMRFLVLKTEDSESPEKIEFSSPQAVRFVDLPTIVETVEQAARSTSIGLGPFQVSFEK